MPVTQSDMVVGNPASIAPEPAMGGELTGPSDVESLGPTLYKALTGSVRASKAA